MDLSKGFVGWAGRKGMRNLKHATQNILYYNICYSTKANVLIIFKKTEWDDWDGVAK